MAIGKRVFEALQRAEARDFESALIPTCVALDATAKRERPRLKVGERYKEFLRENLGIIGLSLGILAPRVLLRLDHPELRPDSEGRVSLEDILYHVVRCGLLHDATIAEYIELSPTTLYGYVPPRLVIGDGIVWGLLLAIVLAPVNSNEIVPPQAWIAVDNQRYSINALWGKRETFLLDLATRMHAHKKAVNKDAD